MRKLRTAAVCLLLIVCLLTELLPVSALAAERVQTEAVQAAEPTAAQATVTLPSGVAAFKDVRQNDWFYNAVTYVTVNSIFSGTSRTAFSPSGSMTRAMVVAVLSRMAGIDTDDYGSASEFTDVAQGSWYAAPVEWAAKYGIVYGTGNGKFSPEQTVTRQEVAVMFVRYFTIFGVSLSDQNLLSAKPKDLSDAADWAKDSLLVLWQRSLMCGDGKGFVHPTQKMTRAECASLCTQIHQQADEWKAQPGEGQWLPVTPGAEDIYTVTFLNPDAIEITTMNARIGLGLGEENVPYYAHPDEDNGEYFWGWFFYDEDGSLHLFNTLYPYNKDMTVFAICGKSTELRAYLEDEYYVIDERVPNDFIVTIRPLESGTEFIPAYDLAVYADEYDRRITYSVVPLDNGDYQIVVENYKPGVAYSMVLSNSFVFLEPTTGEALDALVRYLEFTVEKPVSTELRFRDDIVWLSTTEESYYLGQTEDGLGVLRPIDDTETELGTGVFTYNPNETEHHYEVGTVICVYDDRTVTMNINNQTVRVQRQPPYSREYDEDVYEALGYTYADVYSGANDAFYIVTSVTQAADNAVLCEYREMNSDELDKILYVPDVVPFSVETLPTEAVGTIENYAAYDADLYAEYSGTKKPAPCVGDFVVLYTPETENYGEDDFAAFRAGEYDGDAPYLFGKITEIDGMKLTYELTTEDAVVSAMDYIDDYYVERYVPQALQPRPNDLEAEEFIQQTSELLDDEVLRAFVTTAIEEEIENGSADAEEALEILQNNEISFAEATRSTGLGIPADDDKKIQVTGKNIAVDIDTDHLSYIPNTDGKWKLSLNVGMMLIVKLRLREGVNLYYTISANFTQEACLGLSASGRFDVKWYLFVPVPQHVEFAVSATVDTATDVTLDIRHYTIDKSHMGKISLYGRQADAQEMWENYQNFLLTTAFVSHGAALYSKEAEYYSLVADALAIPAENVLERESAEKAVRIKAKEINAMWQDEQYGLETAWDKFYINGGSTEWSSQQQALAEKAAAVAKDELLANVINITQRLGPIQKLVDKFTIDSEDKTQKAMTELADLNPDGTATETWKANEAAKKDLENAKAQLKEAEKKARDKNSKNLKETFETLEQIFKDLNNVMKAVVTSMNTVIAQMRLDEVQNAAAIAQMEDALETVKEVQSAIAACKRLVTCMKDLLTAVDKVVHLASGDIEGGGAIVAQIYEVVKSLSYALKDVKLVIAEIQEGFCEPGDGQYENCQAGLDVILSITKISDTVMDYFHTLAVILDSNNVHTGETTDGITNVPATTTYWKFRAIRQVDFEEFSLNTEILDKLNNPDEGLDDENIKIIASKYAEMCAITNTWMDLYRKPIKDKDFPIFPGLDVTIGADFVVQANINIAANFNFHIDYGKELRLTFDVLDWDISVKWLDRGNQKLSVSLIAMGTLGFRTGFEIKFGVKIIKIFEVSGIFEIMPYINLYAYVLFQYNRDLQNGESETKFKGSMYIDVGVHLGFKLALKLDIFIYKNTWKFNLWNKNISLMDIGERRNVYNFGYAQPSIAALENGIEFAQTAANGSQEAKEDIDTSTDGLLIVNPATGYKLPASARNMSYMDMTNGALGKVAFDAGHYNYTFFTVPKDNDGISYQNENNLPLLYELKEVPLVDSDGNIIYEENDGEGIPLEITVDIDESDFQERYLLAANEGTPVMHWVESDKLVIDTAGIAAGNYVEDTRFAVNSDGVITFTPDDEAAGTVYSQDVYVYIEWVSGALEGSNYPIRRLVHILWTNEDPVTWLYNEVTLVEQNRVTGGEDTYVVWSNTVPRGIDQIHIPSLSYILNIVDPSGVLYDRDTTTYVGEADNRGTTFYRPTENQNHYIRADLMDYSLEVRGLNADGSARTAVYTEEYGYTLPIPDTFTPQVTTVDEEGHPKYMKFTGYDAKQEQDGGIEVWTGKWDAPIDTALALDLTDTNFTRYLEAVYEDETVKAVFTFDGIGQETVTQYLRRGSAPDMNAINQLLTVLKADAAAQGKTLQVEMSETPSAIMSDREFIIYCHSTFIDAPQVSQGSTALEVKFSVPGLTLDANDVLVYGFVPNTADQAQINWLPQGVDTATVEPEIEYRYYARLTDGDTLERTYSAATLKTISGEMEDTGYTTLLKVSSDAANPQTPLTVLMKLKFTTGTFSEPQALTLTPGKSVQVTVSSNYTPDQIASVYLYAYEEADEPLCDSYKLVCSGTSAKGEELWRSKNVTVYFDEGDMDWAYGKITFSQVR